ncbi:glycosyltransferase family 2 protein [Mangrovimonas sp. AS39]|uniref:glycosyltransferase family 2 protein n=1 Tax=Mangrovimonas futianensis TaxID=2895523 RepID=UPI001E3EF6E3|nr:glycosyltransferase family A protein [Mangrovimonas futianensis]MCF1191238.1 glycosyltransferase family 2 protein [Mangrovimonas futianensis]MCF1194933.1 glycosyltransferase family 2 protein [Mangrovimonas futianensis]
MISIIIPTYNRAHLISSTLESILGQTYTHWECLVIDDGSTDATESLMAGYVARDARFQYHKRPIDRPKGANACRNYGFELSTGEYVNWFDSDDIMLPNKLELQYHALKLHPQAPYCICQTTCYDLLEDRVLGFRSKLISSENRFEDYICYRIFWLTTAPVWRKSFLNTYSLKFDETLHQSQEYDFHIRALAINSDYIALDKPLVEMVRHEGNLSNNWMDSEDKVMSNILVKYGVLQKYGSKLSHTTKLKLIEMITLIYKDLLLKKNLHIAGLVRPYLVSSLHYGSISLLKRLSFLTKVYGIFWSYRIFGKGYQLLKPLDVS